VTTNLLNEKLVQGFVVSSFLFVPRSQEQVSENQLGPLDKFSVAELVSPADFCLAAEILCLPFQEL